ILGRDFSGNGVNAPVHSLAFHGPYTNATWLSSASLVVAGEFTEAIGRDGATVTANHIAILTDPFPLYNHESISNIAYTPLGPMALDDVAHAAAVIHGGGRGGTIYAGGEFLRAGRRASPYMAKWHYEPPAPVQAVVINSSPRCTSRCGAIVVAPAPRTCAPGLEKSGADFPLFDDAGFLDRIEVTGLPIGQPFDIDLHDAGHPGNVIDRIDSVVVATVSPGRTVVTSVDDPGEYAPNPDGLDTGTRAVVVPIPEIPDPSLAVVRFIHAVTDAPAVDVVLDGEVIAAGVAYGETALPAVAPAGEHTIEIRRSSDNELLDTQTVELEPGYRTIVFGGFLDPSANQNGPAAALSEHSAGVSTDAEPADPPELPQDAITLSAPSPNPLRTRASVILAMGEHRRVTVELYDVQGRRVGTLHDGFLPAG